MTAKVIDVHAHILPAFYLDAMRAHGLADAQGNPVGDGFPFPSWSLADSLAMMDRNSVAISVLSVSAPGIRFLPAAEGRTMARALNDEMAHIVREKPSRFASLAILPLPDVDASLAEMALALDGYGFDGIGLYSNIGGAYLGASLFAPILEELDRRGATVFVHPGRPASFDDYSLGLPAPILEYPFDSTRLVTNLVLTGALARYRRIKLIIPHGGGTVPYLAGRIARFAARRLKTDQDEILALLRGIFYDLTAMDLTANLALLKEFVPAEQLLCGYDYPFRPEPAVRRQIAAFDAFADFSEEAKHKIRCANAARLFPRLAGLIAPPPDAARA